MEPVVLNRERAATDRLKRMPMLFDDYRDEDFYVLPRKYSIVARVEVKFPIEPRYRERQHFILSDINEAKIEAITSWYETVKHFNNLLHEKHVYKMHNLKFGLHPGEFNFRHLNGPMELYLNQQTIMEPYTVPIQMAPFPKHIFLNLADIAELPNMILVDIMAIVVHLNTIHRTMWGPFRKIVIMDARWSLHIIKVRGDLLNKNALRWVLAKEDYGIIIGTMFRRFRRQECLESSDHTAIHFNPFHHNTHNFRQDINMETCEMVNFEISGDVHLGSVSLSDGCSTIDFTNFATQGIADGDEKVNVNQDDDSDWLHRNETFKADDVFTTRDLLTPGGVHETIGNMPNHNLERAAYFRERYKNLTPTEREFRRERLRLYNNTPKRKGSKIEYIRKRRARLADTLSQESIAMDSPTYTPEVVHPTTDAIEPDGSAVSPCDWVIPEIASNPFLSA
ncbi:hypothetical protein Zm00014a_007096 [Zea mays]|uniref:Uncharacterized protein n=1 Tax=Zea mays TaxID=4577 RepID=A0A3L6E375_MAIZE|nr:hypothetical protein Zm00014a_007096 [Zea mays]